MQKNYCETHHLFYTSNECPMCVKERFERYEKSMSKGINKYSDEPDTKKNKSEERKPTDEELTALVNRFKKN